ncbi:hypothetical protein PA08_2414 [Cutibacterium modestum P08]|mgnify:FL=1|nr:hypothetical protein PA08_2414 [Cutibacterium modestum P08]
MYACSVGVLACKPYFSGLHGTITIGITGEKGRGLAVTSMETLDGVGAVTRSSVHTYRRTHVSW